jgi:hypothetical protein
MANAYMVNTDDATTQQMTTVQCKSEEKELQNILEHNFQLLPGDQIEPDAPCRWMLVKKEMPVPDSASGSNRWAIDFFFVDQNAIPTFVECKRYADTRSRREVIGQVLEYAANAQHLWTKDTIREHAKDTAKDRSTSVEDSLRSLQIEAPEAVDEFFAKVEEKLKNAEIRIVFFLEKAPEELKRLVEFLNTQMVSSDVLLVEARQYEANGLRIVVPQLFGFTERARQVKQNSKTAGTQQSGAEWNWERLRDDATQRGVYANGIAAMQHVITECQRLGFVCKWGRGKQVGALNVVCPDAPPSQFLSVNSDGRLYFNLGNLSAPEATPYRDRLKDAIVLDLGLKVKDDYQNRYPNYAVEEWAPKVAQVVAVLKKFAPRAAAVSA